MSLHDDIMNFVSNAGGDIGVSVKNLKTGEMIGVNEEMMFPSASTIKILIMAQIYKMAKEGYIRLTDNIVLSDFMKTDGSGILYQLNSKHKFTIEELITLMIIISDNTAANVLIDIADMKNINKMAEDLGLFHTKIQRKMMDFEAIKSGKDNYTCPKDMTRLLEQMYSGKVVDEEYSIKMIEILKKQQEFGRLNLYLPDDVLIAHKPGELKSLEHDVGIVFLKDCDYIISVMTNNMNTNLDGRMAIGKISKMVYDEYVKL
ncbi:serine hydrolase [Thermoanaerobacterium sp. R66]|uniref:serine hydrolase n=1 Tax=Thermoanaerobacterium sp. R66 TaxID=2742479 RepID=UPI00238019E0|nr:serine hydrolase [Thermoanaerobacterium sp. R66]MDE4542745.1 serine hydrolase [Thermoanaerobacterium sp. R66]